MASNLRNVKHGYLNRGFLSTGDLTERALSLLPVALPLRMFGTYFFTWRRLTLSKWKMTWADTHHINANANNDNLPEVLVKEREVCTGTEYHII